LGHRRKNALNISGGLASGLDEAHAR